MSGSRRATEKPYKLEVEDEAWEGLSSLSESAQEKVLVLWRDHLSRTPAKRIPGKLKALKGEHKGFFQFDITRDQRMIYEIDEATKTVYVEYIGKHPEWRMGRGRRRGF